MEQKIYFSYHSIHKTIEKMAEEIPAQEIDSIVAIGTGGFIPARILKTFLKKPLYTVGLKFYDDNNKPIERPKKIQWIDEVEDKLAGQRILLVDEIDDTRTTLAYCVKELLRHNPSEISVAVLHCKKKKKEADFPQELKKYYAGKEIEDVWVYYPWDATDIDAYYKLVTD